MPRWSYRAEIAYDGAAFAGYARQSGLRTVEGALMEALGPLVTGALDLRVGGRTDRGVHAVAQVISFRSRQPLSLADVEARIDAACSGSLLVRALVPVPLSFHARYGASLRRYVYLHPAEAGISGAAVDRLLAALVGHRCFSAYARDTPKGQGTVRTLLDARCREDWFDSGPVLRFDFCSPGFLRRQVRVMVSTALREAAAGAPDDALLRLAEAGDRGATARPAAPGGLYLLRVGYEPR